MSPHTIASGSITNVGRFFPKVGIAARDHAYFVHSFQLAAARPETVLAVVDYGGPVTAMVGRDNLAGTQFHPEKSAAQGLALYRNFLHWNP